MSDKYSAYKRLSCAVILRALDDLEDARRELDKNPNSEMAERMEKDCLRFFRGKRAELFLSFVDLENARDRIEGKVKRG